MKTSFPSINFPDKQLVPLSYRPWHFLNFLYLNFTQLCITGQQFPNIHLRAIYTTKIGSFSNLNFWKPHFLQLKSLTCNSQTLMLHQLSTFLTSLNCASWLTKYTISRKPHAERLTCNKTKFIQLKFHFLCHFHFQGQF